MNEPLSNQPRSSAFYLILIVITTLVALGGVCGAEFTFLDDPLTLWQNPRLNPPTLANVAYYWGHPEYGLYVPVTYTFWSVLAAIAYVPQADPLGSQLNPIVFHCANLVLHVTSALVAFALLRRLVSDVRAACLGAMLLAIHPVQVEPVAWTSGTKDLLAGMFALIALWQYVSYAQEPQKRYRYVLATIAFVLAMLAKPSALVVPVMAAAIDYWLVRRPAITILKSLALWGALAFICAVIGRLAQSVDLITNAPLWARPFLAGHSLAFYLYKLVWPLRLAFDYGQKPQMVMTHWWAYVTWIFPAAIVLVVWMMRRKWPQVWTGTIIFIVGVAPVLGLSTFLYQRYSTTSDHYLYLAMLGPALVLAHLLSKFRQRFAMIAAACILGLLSVRSILQARVWREDVTLYTSILAVNPNSPLALNGLGNVFFARRELALSEAYFRAAMAQMPNDCNEIENVALALEEQTRWDEAIQLRTHALDLRLQQAQQTDQELARCYVLLGLDYRESSRLGEARETMRAALKLDPTNEKIQADLERIESMIAAAATQPATGPTSNP